MRTSYVKQLTQSHRARFGARKERRDAFSRQKASGKTRQREPDGGGPPPSELRPFAHPVTYALVLAAAERAECHQTRSEPGVMPREVFEHKGFVYNAAATRQLRPRLDGLMEAGLLEHARRNSVRLWVLTGAGRRVLLFLALFQQQRRESAG